MTSGQEIQEGPFSFVVCHTLNTLEEYVLVPKVLIEQVKTLVNAHELLWPLGVYVGFTVEGLSLGIVALDDQGKYMHGISQVPLTSRLPYRFPEDVPFGSAVQAMWEKLRGAPAFFVQANYETLMARTQAAHPKVAFPDP